MSEVTSEEVAAIASRGLVDPTTLTADEIKAVCGSALTQRPSTLELKIDTADVRQAIDDAANRIVTEVVPAAFDETLLAKAAIIIRSLLTEGLWADHVVTPQGMNPIIASDVVSQLEAASGG